VILSAAEQFSCFQYGDHTKEDIRATLLLGEAEVAKPRLLKQMAIRAAT